MRDTSPPPEQFDVKAILRGGIPVSEVEDEYIQETLNGMDVSCVFVRRDGAYLISNLRLRPKNESETILEPRNNLSSISLNDGGINIGYLCMR